VFVQSASVSYCPVCRPACSPGLLAYLLLPVFDRDLRIPFIVREHVRVILSEYDSLTQLRMEASQFRGQQAGLEVTPSEIQQIGKEVTTLNADVLQDTEAEGCGKPKERSWT
jgi:hypothetical protein